jgi:hypothetical protein
MGDTQKPPGKLEGDATSQLVQTIVHRVGFANFKATGKGATDIEQLAKAAYNSHVVVQSLWSMCKDFGDALDKAGDTVPESFRAMITSAILNVRSNMELGKK